MTVVYYIKPDEHEKLKDILTQSHNWITNYDKKTGYIEFRFCIADFGASSICPLLDK